MAEQFQLRELYNMRVVDQLAKSIKKVHKAFDVEGFSESIGARIEQLSFGDRAKLIKDNLKKFLPSDFIQAANILIDSLGPESGLEDGKTDYDAFIVVPEADFIAEAGIDHFDLSMKALYEMTKRTSAEWAIRVFIRKYPERTLRVLKKWTQDKNAHVRRLASEGTRPRLPLSSPLKIFQKNPKPVIELLELLKDDPELFVRRSVANNLNDISKDNPVIVVKTLKRWIKNATKERQWLIKHSLRTLFKQGNKDALELMGYFKPELSGLTLRIDRDNLKIGERLSLTAKMTSLKDQNLMIDYIIHYMKANGRLSPKVFKLSLKTTTEGEKLEMTTNHSFRQMTTRKHYKGKHFIELIINGYKFKQLDFMLR